MAEPEKLKVVLLGESGVGKTCIISQFISGIFDSDCLTSLSAQFITKTIEFKDINKAIKFDIWDTAGQEKFRSLAKIFYKDAKVICLCYDISSEKSFTELKEYWYEQQVKLNAEGDPIFAVVANKIDLYADQKVSNNEGKEFADKIGAIFQTTSALSDSGISTLFDNIGKTYLIPGYDYKAGDMKAQEEFIKKKQNEKNQNQKGKNQREKGVTLDKEEKGQKPKKKFC